MFLELIAYFLLPSDSAFRSESLERNKKSFTDQPDFIKSTVCPIDFLGSFKLFFNFFSILNKKGGIFRNCGLIPVRLLSSGQLHSSFYFS